jgi:glyoxylate reductase
LTAHRSESRVFATRSLPGPQFARLAGRSRLDVWEGPGTLPPAELIERAKNAEGLLCLLTDRIGEDLLAACPQLRVISSCSVGLDHIDLDAARARGIAVGFTPGVLVETTADLAFGLLLAAARRLIEADRFVRDGRWTWERRWEPELLLGKDLWGGVLGVIGLGKIGQAVARRAQGFGMRVLGWNRTHRELEGVEFSELDALLEQADFISVHVSLTPETRGLIDAAAIARMPRGAILVNTARGGIVDEDAVAAALRSGQLAAAALDVFDQEPLAPEHPLLSAPNLVVAPHIGSASTATRSRMADLAVENLLAGLAGDPLPRDGLRA